MADFRNPTDLLGIVRDPSLARLLRACGAQEACISGVASDMDAFLALAEILPTCPDHKQAEDIHHALEKAIGWSIPLCPHTAPALWRAWVDTHWYGREAIPHGLPARCPHCPPCEPTALNVSQLSPLPDPLTVGGESLGEWTRAWENALTACPTHSAFSLPDSYAFRRPDPYHAAEVLGKQTKGIPLAIDEINLLAAQALRVWGQWRLRMKGPATPLLLRGGDAEAVQALLAYLQASRALAPLIWIPYHPNHVEPVSGLYACVETGLDLSATYSHEQCESLAQAYRKIAPWGRATVLLP